MRTHECRVIFYLSFAHAHSSKAEAGGVAHPLLGQAAKDGGQVADVRLADAQAEAAPRQHLEGGGTGFLAALDTGSFCRSLYALATLMFPPQLSSHTPRPAPGRPRRPAGRRASSRAAARGRRGCPIWMNSSCTVTSLTSRCPPHPARPALSLTL
jgi:hypothetical protein